MPRDGSGIYHKPPGTDGVPDTPVESAKYNVYTSDVEADLNAARPISSGGTGATTVAGAQLAFNIPAASQQIVNYDTDTIQPGFFWSDTNAIGEPVNTHRFVGYAAQLDANNMIVQATDLDSGSAAATFIKMKTAGVWGSWVNTTSSNAVQKSGDTMTGVLNTVGITMGSTVASAPTDLSKHLNVWGGTYGLSVTPSTLNVVADGAATLQVTKTSIAVNGSISASDSIGSSNWTYGAVLRTNGILYFGSDNGIYWNDERGNGRLASNQNVYSYGSISAAANLNAASTTTTANLNTSGQCQITANGVIPQGGGGQFWIYATAGGGNEAFITYHCAGQFACNMGMNPNGNFYMGGWSHGNVRYQFWTSRDISQVVQNLRFAYAGDRAPPTNGAIDEIGGACHTGANLTYTGVAGVSYIVNQFRFRYLQMQLNGGGWATFGWT